MSMVLTEKDYFDFVINLNKEDEKKMLPNIIRQELPWSSLLFIGYTLQDIDFGPLFQGALVLKRNSRTTSIAVQIPPINNNDIKKDIILNYLGQYTEKIFEVYPYWGDITDFVIDFRERWEQFKIDKKKVMSGVNIR